MNRVFRNTFFFFIIFLVLIAIIGMLNNPNPDTEQLNYKEFRNALSNGEISELTIQYTNEAYEARGELSGGSSFTAEFPANEQIVSEVVSTAEEQVSEFSTVKAEEPSAWARFFTTLIPFIILFILFFFLLGQMQGGGGRMMNFGKSKAKMYTEDKKKTKFPDVAGADEEKQELVEVVDFLKDPRKFTELGARIPKGILLVGPPGTGKTLLAKAVAGEAGVPFFSISGSDFVEMFVGVGASRVRDLFENAKKNAPCIVFIDEIDAVGRQRGAGVGGGHDEREQTLNQLLVEMDGFGVNEGIIMIAATNRPDILDPALLRPGRFDRQITVNAPDVKGRKEVLAVHAKNKPLDESVDLKTIAMRTPGFSGADLENLLNEAALVAARDDVNKISMRHVDEAIDRVIAGPAKKSKVISEKEKNIVAYHESGHTVIGVVLDEADMVHKVTIVPRGQAGGYAVMLPKEDRYFQTKPELLDKITGLLGGRVAEEIIFGEVSTGAHNDFQRATGIARKMVTEFGMSDKLGPLQFGNTGGQVFLGRDIQNDPNYSDQIAYEIDQEIQSIIKSCYERAKEILTENKEQLELIAKTLLEVETLDAAQINGLFYDGVLPEKTEDDETSATTDEESKDVDVEEETSSAKETSEEPKQDNAQQDVKVNIQKKEENVETDEDDYKKE
ncbi:ATP-dependent zinc metalloprotease FtsH [Piscibacillus sp. B03]|uniref:ATP-dependent zinc metalloprotease FtsH n=1 Tax=Piscibacillus sp. B03 TaxID=3457430 RepID=UPI003FCDFEF3